MTKQELKENKKDFLSLLSDSDTLKRFISDLLLCGAYGEEEDQITKRILGASKRTNKVAQLSQQLARVECQGLSGRHAIEVYYSMNQEQRETANKIIQDAINCALNEGE